MKKQVAVIGHGGQGAWHTRQIIASDAASLAGVYDIDPAKVQKALENGIHGYPTIEELLADEAVKAVAVATPNDSHRELVIRCLNAGKNVICEKPAEMSVTAFDEMAAAAEHSGKLFTVHQNRRWDVDFLAMKEIVSSNQIGELIHIESRVHGSRGIPSDWRCTKQQGGGMILDWGKYVSALTDIGYEGYACVEVEDKALEGSRERIQDSVKLSCRYMRRFIIEYITNYRRNITWPLT